MDKVVETIEQNLKLRRSDWAAGPLDGGDDRMAARSDFSLLDEQQTYALAAAAAAQRRTFDEQFRTQQHWREFRTGLGSADYWKSVVHQLRSRAEQVLQQPQPRQYDCDASGRRIMAQDGSGSSSTTDSYYSGSLNEQPQHPSTETREPPPTLSPPVVQERAARAALRAKEIGGYCRERIVKEWKHLQGKGVPSLDDVRSLQGISLEDFRALQKRQQDEAMGNYYVPFDGENSSDAHQQQQSQQLLKNGFYPMPESVGLGEYASFSEDTPAHSKQQLQHAFQPCVVDGYADMEDESWQLPQQQQSRTRPEPQQAHPSCPSHDEEKKEDQQSTSGEDPEDGDPNPADESNPEENNKQQNTVGLHPNAHRWGASKNLHKHQSQDEPLENGSEKGDKLGTAPQDEPSTSAKSTSCKSSTCPKQMARHYQHSYHWGSMTPKANYR